MNVGKVYLVGAGPGDPELLTIKAVKAIARADVVLVDDLVSDAVLDYARADARLVHVGKRGGCQSTPQAFIERLMVAEARRGLTVVRLKGGDPFVFGRGGEECEALAAAGIDCEIINGITAGLAAPTALGIPLTHRDACHGAVFVTGHAGEGASEPDWRALVATGMPLVIYMGVSRSDTIQQALIAAGMRTDMPVAIVQNATRDNERTIVTTLARLATDIRAHRIGSPAIMIVGETVRYAKAGVTGLDAPALRRETGHHAGGAAPRRSGRR
jgi:uroporphyrin-III C-methyltransferase